MPARPITRALRLMPKAAGDASTASPKPRSSIPQDRHPFARAEVEAPAGAARAVGAGGISGGVSGFFGIAALPIELPVTTTLMLRAIADIARHHGEDLSTLEARLACVEVFALGAPQVDRRRTDLGYYASRALIGRLAADAPAPARARRRRTCRPRSSAASLPESPRDLASSSPSASAASALPVSARSAAPP